MAASPASANDTATTTQISGIVTGDVAAPSANDGEFTRLFASWEKLDGDSRQSMVAVQPAVSVPSRMPVDALRMTSAYGMRDHPVLRKRAAHKGVDLAAPTGTPVYATADGYVARAEYFSSYGNYVEIKHGGELETRYAHLSGYAVSAGSRVEKGDLIGYVGSTGRSTGPHLHYEVRVAGEAVDPRPYMLATDLALKEDETAMGGPDE